MVSEALRREDGSASTLNWELADPSLLLQLTVDESPKLQEQYGAALRRHPCDAEHPWDLVLGFDVFIPGDKFNFANARKSMCAYFNFANLGALALSQGSTWLVPIAVRHEFCVEAQGGWSAMLALFLRRLFLSALGLATAGVPVTINGVIAVIFARLHVLISDGDGLRLAFCWRGAGSIKPCLRHFNVLSKGSDLSGRLEGYVEITCDDPEKFRATTTDQFHKSVDMVAAVHRRLQADPRLKGLHDKIVMKEGFNYCESGLPYDTVLRNAGVDVFKAIRLDWMHSALQDGSLTICCHLFLVSCGIIGLGYEDVEKFFQLDWQFPKCFSSKGKQLYRIFCSYRANREGEHDKMRANASELLGMYTLFRFWAQTEVGDRPEVQAQRAAFDAACTVIDIIQMAKKHLIGMKVASKKLSRAVANHLRLHKAAYGLAHIKPKHHWMFDVAEQMWLDDMLHDQFIIERLHLIVRPHADRARNTRRYEYTVLSGVLNAQLGRLKELRSGCCLLDVTTVKIDGFDDAELGDNMHVMGMHISVGDLVFHRDVVGEVLGCVNELGALLAIVEQFELVIAISSTSGRWRRTGRLRVWRALALEQDGHFSDLRNRAYACTDARKCMRAHSIAKGIAWVECATDLLRVYKHPNIAPRGAMRISLSLSLPLPLYLERERETEREREREV